MSKLSEQLKGNDTQSLNMARQSLGRVKDLDLTPEQKEQIMAIIDEAKEYEKNKELSKALNAYNKLLRFLKIIKSEGSPVSPEIIRRQLQKIEEAIEKNETNTGVIPKVREKMRAELEKQKELIEGKRAVEKVINENNEIISKHKFSIDEIHEFIAEVVDLPLYNFMLEKIQVDENGRIMNLNFSVVGSPEFNYAFSVKQASKKFPERIIKTEITEFHIDFKNPMDTTMNGFADYNEDSDMWTIK